MALNNQIQLNIKIPKIVKELDKEFEKAVKKSVIKVHSHLIRKILRGKRSGNRYMVPATDKKSLKGTSPGEGKKPKKPKFYTASAPGEAPAVRLGDLRTSYRYVVKKRGMAAEGYVGTPLKYGYWLEKGTARMAKRPHLQRAFEESRPEWEKLFEGLIK
jgi:hypothetical protein